MSETPEIPQTLPTIIRFTTTWCGPCKLLAPVMAEIVGPLTGKANSLTVDIDSEEGRVLAVKHKIMSVPTILVLKSEEEVFRHIGFTPKSVLEPKILAAIGG